jgi:hypothetical protein
MARPRPPLPLRRIDGPAQPTRANPHRCQKDHHDQDNEKGDRRYGIVAITRRTTRDELHHAKGRDPSRVSPIATSAAQLTFKHIEDPDAIGRPQEHITERRSAERRLAAKIEPLPVLKRPLGNLSRKGAKQIHAPNHA